MSIVPPQAYLAAWSTLPTLGPMRWKRIESAFGFDPSRAWQADLPALLEAGIESGVAETWFNARATLDLEKLWQHMQDERIELISWHDERYPARLKELYDAPPWLYLRGDSARLSDDFSIAIVGTRKMSAYGKRVTENLTTSLTEQGITIVSGLALGIDAVAHSIAVKQKGRTIAVLASGLDDQHIYPTAHHALARNIIDEGGLLVSEYPPGRDAFPYQFPYRNRIIAGLSLATVVIEAPAESGALITAKYALEQNREVFAIPGNIYDPNSIGPNNLIKMGAKVSTSAADILESLNLTAVIPLKENRPILPASPNEAAILEHLADQPVHVDELVRLTELPAPTVNATLTLMEMSGKVRNLGGMHYVRGR